MIKLLVEAKADLESQLEVCIYFIYFYVFYLKVIKLLVEAKADLESQLEVCIYFILFLFFLYSFWGCAGYFFLYLWFILFIFFPFLRLEKLLFILHAGKVVWML